MILASSLLLLLTFAIAIAFNTPILYDSDEAATERPKRNTPVSGLIPFPRVGRADKKFSEDRRRVYYTLPDGMLKREGLIPFPRVGRSGPKRNGASGNGGLWFGPRLGRTQKRTQPDSPDLSLLSGFGVGEDSTNQNQLYKAQPPFGYLRYPQPQFRY